MTPSSVLTWLRARLHLNQRGVVYQGVLSAVLVILACIALSAYILTTYSIHKR